MTVATIIFIAILGILSAFQIALALGVPIGRFTWGGQHRVLPRKLRIGSLLSPIIYFGFAVCILSKSSMSQIIPEGVLLDTLVWIIFAYLTLSVFVNTISRSKLERYTMAPTSFVLAVCVLIVALR